MKLSTLRNLEEVQRFVFCCCQIILATSISLFATIAMAQLTSPKTDDPNVEAVWRLRSLGFWTSAKDSLADPANKQALLAFQKVEGLKRTGRLNDLTFEILLDAPIPKPQDSIHLTHLEVDLNRQVLFVVDSLDRVTRILSISTGSGKYFASEGHGRYAMTPRGNFKVYYKITGWRKSPLGMLYDPLYIRGGVAIHGANQVPSYPASHGCIRIPMYAAPVLYRSTPIGTIAIVYGENPKPTRDPQFDPPKPQH